MAAEKARNSSHSGEIYRYLYHQKGVSQQQIAADLCLSMPTVLAGLKSLREQDLIRDDDTFASTGGRKARVIRVNPDARYAIGVEITANHVSIVIIDMQGHILRVNRIRHRFTDSYFYYSTLAKLVEEFLAGHPIDRSRILGIGVSLAAIVDSDHRTILSSRRLGAPADLHEKLSAHFSWPLLLFSDAKAGGFAESWDLDTDRAVLYLSLNNTVGGAMIQNRRIYMGDNQKSFELGHMTLVPDGRLCYCGRKGCVQEYLKANLLSDRAGGKMDLFFSGLEEGNVVYEEVFREYMDYLAIVINNLRMLYDCDIVVGGYVGAHLTPHLGDLRERVRMRSRFREESTFLSCCRHRYNTAAIGSALYFINEFIREIG